MPHPTSCDELRRALAWRGRDAVAGLRDELRVHAAGCPTCRLLVAAVSQMANQPGGRLYTPALRRRTLAAVQEVAPRSATGLGWLLLPPAALGALVGTAAPVWILATVLQILSVPQACAWATAAGLVLSTSLAASGLVAILVDRPRDDWQPLTGASRSQEV